MGSYVGVIISEIAPSTDNFYAWYKPSTKEWYEPSEDFSNWTLAAEGFSLGLSESDVADLISSLAAALGHTHTELASLNITDNLSANGEAGLTGSRVISSKRLTFTKGILTGFEDA